MTWVATKDRRIKKRHGRYWARFKTRGRKVEQSLETTSFEVAKRQVEEIQGKILMGRSWKRERQLFQEAWLEFLIDKRSGNKVRPAREKTLHEYTAFGLRYFLPFFGKHRLGDVEDMWPDFIDFVRSKHGQIQFFNIHKYMNGLMTWAVRHGKLQVRPYLHNPDSRAEALREEQGPGKAYSAADLLAMRDAAAHHGRFYLFMLMAQYMGMRPSEITQLKKERIDFDQGVIELKKVDTKTNTGRRVPIHPVVIDLLRRQVQESGSSPYLYPNRADALRPMDRTGFKKVWARILADAGVIGRLYDFRHTFITNAISQGMNPAVVAEITGTSIRVIQKHYLHLTANDLKRAITEFHL